MASEDWSVPENMKENLDSINKWKVNEQDRETSPLSSFKNNDYVLFPREYYSGCDITISFGNVILDNILDIKYQMQQQTQPIYGYGSHTFDAVMTGNRLITGSFRINFKETFYIKSVLDKLENPSNKNKSPDKNVSPKIFDNKDLTLNQVMKHIKELDSADLKTMADEYEKRLWPGSKKRIDKTHQTMLLDPFGGYDYYTKEGWKSKYNHLLRDGFNIIISFGETLPEVMVNPAVDTKGTVKVLNGVFLTGYETIYQPTGEAIYEEYMFIAKDMDNSLDINLSI